MPSHAASTSPEADVFRHQARAIQAVVRLQTDGITQDESLVHPQAEGNSLNWVVGHLVAIYNNALPVLGQSPVSSPEKLEPYRRGAHPLEEQAQPLQLTELLTLWDEVSQKIDAGLAALTPEQLDQPAPFSPTGNPKETVRTLISTVMFHQAYHTGQTALLRRIVGKPGAIK